MPPWQRHKRISRKMTASSRETGRPALAWEPGRRGPPGPHERREPLQPRVRGARPPAGLAVAVRGASRAQEGVVHKDCVCALRRRAKANDCSTVEQLRARMHRPLRQDPCQDSRIVQKRDLNHLCGFAPLECFSDPSETSAIIDAPPVLQEQVLSCDVHKITTGPFYKQRVVFGHLERVAVRLRFQVNDVPFHIWVPCGPQDLNFCAADTPNDITT